MVDAAEVGAYLGSRPVIQRRARAAIKNVESHGDTFFQCDTQH